ncbi:MAG TPA: hypothetical protein VMW67_03505 [Desulfobacteria bacterium]|nr:hypothetical protein [Desulfobacteria bacterium]
MEQYLGLYKKLRSDEELITEGREIVTVDFAKEIHKKSLGILKRTQIGLTGRGFAKIYLTNKRLLFLNLYLLRGEELSKKRSDLSILEELPKSKIDFSISGVSGTWFELPIDGIEDIQIVSDAIEIYYKTTSKLRESDSGFLEGLGISRVEGIEEKIILHADNAGMWKMQIDSLLSK